MLRPLPVSNFVAIARWIFLIFVKSAVYKTDKISVVFALNLTKLTDHEENRSNIRPTKFGEASLAETCLFNYRNIGTFQTIKKHVLVNLASSN